LKFPASISVQHIHCRYELQQELYSYDYYIVTSGATVGFIIIIQIPVTPEPIQESLKTADTAN